MMAANKIAGIRLRRRVRTTIPEPAEQVVPDLLERDFTADAPCAAGSDLAEQASLIKCFSAGPVVIASVQMHRHVGRQGLKVLERVQSLSQ